MDAKKLLIGVATTALGWMFGMWAYKSLMGGGGMSAPTMMEDAPSEEPAEFGYSNNY
jgi:hypothetical protein